VDIVENINTYTIYPQDIILNQENSSGKVDMRPEALTMEGSQEGMMKKHDFSIDIIDS
jgi:hypothetical protein